MVEETARYSASVETRAIVGCFLELQLIGLCEAPKPGGPLTNNCQSAENSWISGDPIPHCYVPFTEIHNFNKIG